MRLGIFRDFVAEVRSFGDVWLAAGEELASHFTMHDRERQ
jgi:hypothetical protein